MKHFGKKMISLVLALMCIATIGAISASAATTDYWVNRPYSNVKLISGRYSDSPTTFQGVRVNQHLNEATLNDRKDRTLFGLNNRTYSAKNNEMSRVGGSSGVSLFDRLHMNNNTNLYKEKGKVGTDSQNFVSDCFGHGHSFGPAFSFNFD